jgi:Transposase DDE domain/Transposase domain (DUF772)
MSLPEFSTQGELFSTAGLSASMFAPTDRYRLFAKVIYPRVVAARVTLEKCYCTENGRVALEPVLMLGVSLLQFLDGVPDRQAVEMLQYHAGWNFALNRQLGDPVFHPTSLGHFRDRLQEHQQSALGFTTIWEGLEQAGLVSRQSRQRLDSTQMFGRVARMSRLDCVRESLRLALKELEETLGAAGRPRFWVGLWERYVESQVDYRAGAETLARKLAEAGADVWQLLEWLGQPEQSAVKLAPQVELLRRVFTEQFDVRVGQATPLTKERVVVPPSAEPGVSGTATTTPVQAESPPAQTASPDSTNWPNPQTELPMAQAIDPAPEPAPESCASEPGPAIGSQPAAEAARVRSPLRPEVSDPPHTGGCACLGPETPGPEVARAAVVPPGAEGAFEPDLSAGEPPRVGPAPNPPRAGSVEVQPKDKKQLSSERVQNPHEPEATYAAKGQGDHWKEHVGYKIQVAETVCEVALAPGEPTRNFIAGIVTHAAYESDEAGADKMDAEQAAMGLDKPPVQYVDGAYISARKLVEAAAAGRELIGPAPPPATNNEGRFTSDLFRVEVEQHRATCPAGHQSTQCSRLEEQATKRVSFRFEWDTATCAACPLRGRCIKGTHKHRTLVVGEHHTALQARRQEQRTEPFKQRMKHRNGIEGTQSELVRGHDVRHARYRGLAKTKLQNYFTGAACNVKRWLRRTAWEMRQAVAAAGQSRAATAN